MGRPPNLAAEPDDLICADRCHRVNFHSLRDHTAGGEATMTKCNTEDMLAGALAKALNTEKTDRSRDRMLTTSQLSLIGRSRPKWPRATSAPSSTSNDEAAAGRGGVERGAVRSGVVLDHSPRATQ